MSERGAFPWNARSRTCCPPWITQSTPHSHAEKDDDATKRPKNTGSSSATTSAKRPKTTSSTAEEDSDIFEDPSEAGRYAFQWLIEPMTLDTFEQDYWEKKPMFISREKQRDYYQQVFASEWIKQWLHQGSLSYGTDIDVTQYRDYQRFTLNGEGVAPGDETWKRFTEEKCSLRLVCPHAHSDVLLNLLSTLEEYFCMFVGSNVYLTPPASQGFAPHYDDIEAFVLQVEGSKHWRVYAPRSSEEVLPRYSSPNFNQVGDEYAEKKSMLENDLYISIDARV
eukprot:gb/GECG01014478.1/.p1 GENE.gb/GECG01014478.1/~~gb/GECG01014478.1/.p1  ORF type:complete len:280 (+),score=44.18 gb/GECG01014478.1/:1-840(+)